MKEIDSYISQCGVGTAWYRSMIEEQLIAYAEFKVKQERLRCADICENLYDKYYNQMYDAAQECAIAILKEPK